MFFDEAEAVSDSPGKPGESLWDFTRRSSWPRAALVRAQLTAFLRLVAEGKRPQFLARLQSADEREVMAAHTELFLLALLIGTGRTCEVEVATPGGGTIDLLVDGKVGVEVHRSALPDAEQALARRRRGVLAGLDKVRSPDFWIFVRMSVPGRSPSVRRIRAEIEEWVETLDWVAERERYEAAPGAYEGPSRTWSTEDGSITLGVLPRSSESRDGRVTVGVVEGGPVLIEGFERIESSVRRKRRQHRSLDRPLFVVIDLSEGISHDDEVAAALYGPVVLYAAASPPYEARDRSKGVWPAAATDSPPTAVLTVDELGLGHAEHARVVQWCRPNNGPLPAVGPWQVASLHRDSFRMADAAESVGAALARAGVPVAG